MSVREHPTKPGIWVIDCRPDGYKGKRLRQEFAGTKEKAIAWERKIMRQNIEVREVSQRTCASIYNSWIIYYRANREESTAKDAASCSSSR